VKKTAVVAVLVVVLAFSGMAFAFENEPEGFRGLKWGDPPNEGMELVRKGNEWMTFYRNPGDTMKLGDARFYMILYQFYAPSDTTIEGLMGVGLYFKEKENFDILETICKVKFGEPTQEGFQELGWASLDTTALLIYDGMDESGYLALGSTPLFQQYTEESEKKQAEEAEKDW